MEESKQQKEAFQTVIPHKIWVEIDGKRFEVELVAHSARYFLVRSKNGQQKFINKNNQPSK